MRGAAEAMGDSPNPNYLIVPGLVPLVDKRTGEIEYVVPHAGGCAAPRHDAAGAWLLKLDEARDTGQHMSLAKAVFSLSAALKSLIAA